MGEFFIYNYQHHIHIMSFLTKNCIAVWLACIYTLGKIANAPPTTSLIVLDLNATKID